MIKYICISLVRSQERRAAMKRQFKTLGIEARFFNGIEPVEPIETAGGYNWPKRLRRHGVPMSRGEIGCFLSHRAVWSELVQSGDEAWCVLEDDVILRPGWRAAIEELYTARRHWDIVRLMGLTRRPKVLSGTLPSGLKLMWMRRHPDGTQCYVITREAATRMLAYTATFHDAVDNAIDRHWEHRLRLFITLPEYAEQAGFASEIGHRSEERGVIARLRAKFYRRIEKARMAIYHLRRRPRRASQLPISE